MNFVLLVAKAANHPVYHRRWINYEKDWLDVIDVIGGVVGSVLIFLLGYLISSFINKRKVRKTNQEYYQYFIEYLEHQKVAINEQVEELKKVKLTLELDQFHVAPNLKISLQPFYILDSFNKEKLLTAYKDNKRTPSEMMETLGELEFAKILIKGIEQSLFTYTNRQNELTEVLNVDLMRWDTLQRQDYAYLIEKVSEIDVSRLTELHKLERKFSNEKSRVVEMVEQYYIPTAELLKEIDDKSPDQRLQQFISLSRNMGHAVANKKVAFNHFFKLITNTIEKLEGLALK